MDVAARVGAVFAAGIVLASSGCAPAASPEPVAGTRSATTRTLTTGPTPSASATTASATRAATPTAAAPSTLKVLERAKARAKATTSGAYEARFTDGKDPVEVSFRGSRTDYEIVLKVGEAEATFIVHGTTSYTRGNAAFWSQANVPDPGRETFVRVPTSELGPATDLTLEARLQWVLTSARRSMRPVVTDGEVKGISAWTLTGRGGARSGSLYVSKDSYDVLRFSTGNQEVGAYEFHDWNEAFDIPTPPASRVVKGQSLQSRSRSSA